MGGSSCCDADSCSDVVGNLRIWEGPFVTELECQLFDQKICLATQETVSGYNEGCEVATKFDALVKIFFLLVTLVLFQDLMRVF